LQEKGGNVGDAATILMAMFESDKGSASESDVLVIQKDEEQPLQEDDDEDPSFKVRFHSEPQYTCAQTTMDVFD
jgi:hypothetical protein